MYNSLSIPQVAKRNDRTANMAKSVLGSWSKNMVYSQQSIGVESQPMTPLPGAGPCGPAGTTGNPFPDPPATATNAAKFKKPAVPVVPVANGVAVRDLQGLFEKLQEEAMTHEPGVDADSGGKLVKSEPPDPGPPPQDTSPTPTPATITTPTTHKSSHQRSHHHPSHLTAATDTSQPSTIHKHRQKDGGLSSSSSRKRSRSRSRSSSRSGHSLTTGRRPESSSTASSKQAEVMSIIKSQTALPQSPAKTQPMTLAASPAKTHHVPVASPAKTHTMRLPESPVKTHHAPPTASPAKANHMLAASPAKTHHVTTLAPSPAKLSQHTVPKNLFSSSGSTDNAAGATVATAKLSPIKMPPLVSTTIASIYTSYLLK